MAEDVEAEELAQLLCLGHSRMASTPWVSLSELRREQWRDAARACIAAYGCTPADVEKAREALKRGLHVHTLFGYPGRLDPIDHSRLHPFTGEQEQLLSLAGWKRGPGRLVFVSNETLSHLGAPAGGEEAGR